METAILAAIGKGRVLDKSEILNLVERLDLEPRLRTLN